MTEIQKNCSACNALIRVRLADHKRGWGRFCDKGCAAAYKVGMRPRDVNERHAKESFWAANAMASLKSAGLTKWPAAPTVDEQVGQKVRVKPIHHSPTTSRKCRECGEITTNGILCFECETHEEGMSALEAGWDGHKS